MFFVVANVQGVAVHVVDVNISKWPASLRKIKVCLARTF